VSKDDKTAEALNGSWAGAAAIAGAAIGSAAVTAALMFASRRKDRTDKKVPIVHLTPPESD